MSEDFSNAKRGPVVPPDPTKERITIRLDRDVIDHFRSIVSNAGGGNYQTLINAALREHIEADDKALEKKLRKIIREELKQGLRKAS
jgi:uncharacterized protein (DUF4415 family)